MPADITHPPVPTTRARAASRFTRALKASVFALLAYGNLAVITSPEPLRPAGCPRLAIPALLFDMLLMPGMFSSYNRQNQDFLIEARVKGSYVRLPLKDYFPNRLGVTYAEFFAVRQLQALGDEAQNRAIAEQANRIVARYQRLHPRTPIESLRLASELWPKDPRGYRASKSARTIQYRVLLEVGVP